LLAVLAACRQCSSYALIVHGRWRTSRQRRAVGNAQVISLPALTVIRGLFLQQFKSEIDDRAAMGVLEVGMRPAAETEV
jgi:hypothetical protein